MSAPAGPSADVIVVLGCRVIGGRPTRALERRLQKAAELHRNRPELPIIMSGGKVWDGAPESEIMARWWVSHGPNAGVVRKESQSLTTRENALRVAEVCARLGYRHVALVTCDFHMQRATRLFVREQLVVTPVPALTERTPLGRLRLELREWGAAILGEIDSWIR